VSFRGHDWAPLILGCLLLAPGALAHEESAPAGTLSTADLVAGIVHRIDEGEWVVAELRDAAGRGVEAAMEAARFLDPERPTRTAQLYDFIALVGRRRRLPGEALRLYDPKAYHLFYTDAGRPDQEQLLPGLDEEDWPRPLPRVAVRAAPVPALAWMAGQATAEQPRLANLAALLNEWSQWIEDGHERQYTETFIQTLDTLAASPAVTADPVASKALLGAVAHTRAASLTPFVRRQLSRKDPAWRGLTCIALGNLATKEALDALAAHAEVEQDSNALSRLCSALKSFPDSPKAGNVALRIFKRTSHASIRRTILYALSKTDWPQKDDLIAAAFVHPGDGVLGAALGAVNSETSPAILEKILARAAEADEPTPHLVDAMGHIHSTEAAERLSTWLQEEENEAMRIKLIVALESVGGKQAQQALVSRIDTETSPAVMVHVLSAAGRLEARQAAPKIVALASNPTTPAEVRVEAIWALGHIPTRASLNCLNALAKGPATFYDGAPGVDIEQARFYTALARLKAGLADARPTVERMYREGAPIDQLSILAAFGYLRLDHPLISEGLRSPDFAVLLAAVKAAHDVGPKEHLEELKALRLEPLVAGLLGTGLQDVETLRYYLDRAIRKGEGR